MLGTQSRLSKSLPQEGPVLTKAVVRAAKFLELTDEILARVLGLDVDLIPRYQDGSLLLERNQDSFAHAIDLVRLYRSLNAIVGGDNEIARDWLRNENLALKAVPRDLIQSEEGLRNVIRYLDARRALV